MGLPVKLRHLPQRIATGAFILNSGIGKLNADEETAAQLHGFAVGAYPFLAKLKPKDFVRLLSATEITLGAALLVPVIPSALVGAGLTMGTWEAFTSRVRGIMSIPSSSRILFLRKDTYASVTASGREANMTNF